MLSNQFKCAISTYVSIPPYKSASDHPLINQYMKGVFNLRPPKARYTATWDVKLVFNHFSELPGNSNLTDKQLSQKLLLLLLLLGGQRMNTIFSFTTDRMKLSELTCVFSPDVVLKHSRRGRKLDSFTYYKFPDNKLCVIECLQEYLARRGTRVPDTTTKLLITYGRPYKAASQDTLSRWVKDLFKELNILGFSPHSCRSASTSKAKTLGLNIDDIIEKGCWANSKNFFKYYDKNILQHHRDVDFSVLLE